MKWLQAVSLVALAGQLAIHVPAAERETTQAKTTPLVLRSSEPSDNVVLMLPGPSAPPKRAADPPSAPSSPPASVPAPARAGAPAPAASLFEPPPVLPLATEAAPKLDAAPVKPMETASRREPPESTVKDESNAIAKNPKPALPPDFVKDSAMFCQKQIGHWKPADARSLLGESLRQRPAYGDDQKTANGRIYAFSDPSGRYKELELDFDQSTGTLRTVFGYPPQMTWLECLRLWGDRVDSADARQGRTFYSYLNRRLDVLVDQKGNVISLGLY